MSASSDIDISGTFRNLLNNGARTPDCIGELIDNSIDAGSTNVDIHLLTENGYVIIADNGIGMNKQGLKKAYTLNFRTEATNDKQGRFGYGINLATAHMTQLKSMVTTISKTVSDEFPNQIEIDFPEIVRTGYYMNVASEVTRSNEVKYNRYVKDAFNTTTGTVHILPGDEVIFNETQIAMCSANTIESWRYLYGVKYNKYINDGLTIRIIIGDLVLPVRPIDPLAINDLPAEYKCNVLVEIYRDNITGELLVNIPERGWILSNKPKFSNKLIKTTPLPTSFDKIGELTVESGIALDWEKVQKSLFEGDLPFDPVTNPRTGRKCQATVEFMGGRYYNRNKKNIAHVPIKTPTSGNTSGYKYVTNSRHRISFPVELDSYTGIQVNKAKIQEELIHTTIKRICDMLEKEFVDKHYAANSLGDEPELELESEPDVMMKTEAIEILGIVMNFFNAHPERKHLHSEEIIEIIVKMAGKSSSRTADNSRTRQWRLVAERPDGMDTLLAVMADTIESQRDGTGVIAPESLNALLRSVQSN